MDRYVHDAVLDMQMARHELMSALDRVGARDWSRYVPYGRRTLHDLLAHVAAADQIWAQAAQGLLKGEGETGRPLTADEAAAARRRAVERGRAQSPAALLDEMARRRRLLLSLYELLEPRHLALALTSFGERHNSARERIWVGYHDRLHAADVARALRMQWSPPTLSLQTDLQPLAEALSPDPSLYVIYNVDPVNWERPSSIPGWSYRQLLSHIATGDWVLQFHLRHILDRGAVAEWPEVEEGNAERIAARANVADRALTEEYVSMRHETLVLLSRLEARHLDLRISLWWEPPPNERSVREYLLAFPRHDQSHREQLRPAMRYARAMGAG
ncbi:MAG: maleylpyruvate isomerase N-terminal domain-containing protein [Chloroflexota bacterium]|nr:maleylpyruvate isomerase N-terminal domain-containing protein [Chloroflexota bacterium]